MSFPRSFSGFLSSPPLLSELIEQVDVGTKWYLLGTLLHVDSKRLDGFEQLPGHDDTSKTLKMFQHWLTTTPTASRRQVLEALRRRVVNEHTVADKYEKYLKELHDTTYTPPSTEAVSILQRNIQSLNEAVVSPVQVSQLLYCKRCISEATLDKMERIDQRRSVDDKKTTLLTGMQETVSSDYRKLKDIATVLSDVKETRDIANEIMTKYEEKISQEDDSTVVQPQEGVGGNEDLASDILRNNYSALSQSITQPVLMATLLYKEVISDEVLSCVMSTRGSVSDSRAVLLKAVRDAVHSNYKHLELFVTVLRKFSETAHIGDTIFEEYSQYFHDKDNTMEEMETYLTESIVNHLYLIFINVAIGKSLRGASSAESGSESSKEVKETLGRHKILFPRSMEEKFQELRIKFGSTFFQVRRNFAKDQNLNIDEMKLLVIDCFPDLSSQVFNKKTINGVLEVVKTKCNIINMRPLEVLTVEFNIKEAEKVIKIYKEYARDFCKSTSIQLCLDKELQAVRTPSRLKKETVIFILEWNPNESTLQDINDVLEKLEPLENYHIHIQIDTIKTGGSVVVTCYCPAEYTGSLIMGVLGKIEILQEKGLKEFKVGNCTIWNNTAHEVLSAMTTKEMEQPTKKTVNNYEDMERDLLSMKQQLAEKEKQVQELEMKLQTKQEKEDIHILPTDTEKELASLKELSETRLEEIEQLKLKLEDNNRLQVPVEETSDSETIKDESSDDDTSSNEDIVMKPDDKSLTVNLQKDGKVEWIHSGVRLTSPSVDQCKEVISKLEEKHKIIILHYSSSDSIQVLIPTVLERGTIDQLDIYSSLLSCDDVLSFSYQLSTNKSLTRLNLIHSSVSDDGVIALAQSLQYNRTLKHLYLRYNPDITSACAQSLAELLLTNNTITGLRLDHTNIDTDGVMILMESLKTNNTLRKLGLDKQHKEPCSTLPYYEHIKDRLDFFGL
uniref:Death domain-containing protein n=1 Tax=Amphimedon queenslandica TaxID=400682 RepID=A0A1X7TEG0_AMPQE